MADAKTTNKKAKAGDTAAKATTNKGDATQLTGTTSAPETGSQENQNQTGQNNSEQGADTQSASLDTQGENQTNGAQGGNTESEVIQPVEPKANAAKRNKIAKEVFSKNSGLSVVFFTSDFLPFGNNSDAHKHAATLTSKTVTPIHKED
ncbi:hypothetical protein LJB95_03220 [Paludibacteraceae bacterium OttesenSCG-928-F17]|nr:hypothetical protein [Paludibacteraceae bacterium OttesenSCG-928-F17]